MPSITGPARAGHRNATLLAPLPQPAPETDRVYATARPMKMGEHVLPLGVEVPGAAGWLRLEAWVNQRRLRLVLPGESYETYVDFLARAQAAGTTSPRPRLGGEIAWSAPAPDPLEDATVTVVDEAPIDPAHPREDARIEPAASTP